MFKTGFCVAIIILLKGHICKSDMSALGNCLKRSQSPGLMTCVGHQALVTLQTFEDANNFSLANDIVMVKDESVMSRSLPNFLEQDPMDFRGILENAGAVISQRSLQWNMATIYPGLQMRVGPSLGANGMLEFVLDPDLSRDDRYLGEEPSTARILTKQFILPFLLGIKFNLATLLPLVFAALILLSKKALLLGKFALFLSGLFGFSGLFGLGGLGGFGGFGGGGGGHHYDNKPHYGGGGYGHHDYNSGSGLSGGYYRDENKMMGDGNVEQTTSLIDKFYEYEKKLSHRNNKIYERELDDLPESTASSNNQNSYRSFAWQTVA